MLKLEVPGKKKKSFKFLLVPSSDKWKKLWAQCPSRGFVVPPSGPANISPLPQWEEKQDRDAGLGLQRDRGLQMVWPGVRGGHEPQAPAHARGRAGRGFIC